MLGYGQKIANYLVPCPRCRVLPKVWEELTFGSNVPRFIAECPKCGRHTNYQFRPQAAITAWNKGHVKERRVRKDDHIDNDGLVCLMENLMHLTSKDYVWYASKEHQSRFDQVQIKLLEEFIIENPYALPYNSSYVLQEMKNRAEKLKKARKKQVS